MAKLDWSKVNKQKEELEARLDRGNGGGGIKWWKPVNGVNRIRILPGWADEGEFAGQFWREVAQHWNVGEDVKGPVLCPRETPGLSGSCPICAFCDELKNEKGDANAQQLRKDLRAKRAFFLNIIDVKNPRYTAEDIAEWKKARPDQDVPFEIGDMKIQTWACQQTIFDQILAVMKTNELDITDLEEGKDLQITKFPNKDPMKTRYEVVLIIKSAAVPLSPEDKLPDLSMIGQEKSYDELKKLLSDGVGGDYAADRKALPSSTKKTAGAKSGAKPAPAADPEDDKLPAGWGGAEKEDDAEDLMADMESAMGDD